MAEIAFDTLHYYEKLTQAGFSEKQAKVQVDAMQDVVKSYAETSAKEFAAKSDIYVVRDEIQAVRKEVAEAKHEILKWMVTAMLAQTALLVGIIAFLK